MFHGPRGEVEPYFQSLGFYIPERKAVSDFLQEVTSKKDQKVLLLPCLALPCPAPPCPALHGLLTAYGKHGEIYRKGKGNKEMVAKEWQGKGEPETGPLVVTRKWQVAPSFCVCPSGICAGTCVSPFDAWSHFMCPSSAPPPRKLLKFCNKQLQSRSWQLAPFISAF